MFVKQATRLIFIGRQTKPEHNPDQWGTNASYKAEQGQIIRNLTTIYSPLIWHKSGFKSQTFGHQYINKMESQKEAQIFYTVNRCQELYRMGRSAFFDFRSALGLKKKKNIPFTADELLMMDAAMILREAGCTLSVLKDFREFWLNSESPANLETRFERFVENYQLPKIELKESFKKYIQQTQSQLGDETNV